MSRVVLAVALLLLSTPAFAQEPTADEIVDKALDQNAMGFQSGKAQLTLTVEDAGGAKRVRSLEVKSKKIEEERTFCGSGSLTQSLILACQSCSRPRQVGLLTMTLPWQRG